MSGFVFAIIAFVVVLVILGVIFNPAARMRRALREIPETPIGQAQAGRVKIRGKVDCLGEPLVAPLSGRRCAVWEIHVEQRRSSGKSSHWVTLIKETQGQDFLLRDDSGKALVRFPPPGFLWMVNHKDVDMRSGTFNDASPELEAYLSRHGKSSKGLVFNKAMRYHEGVLEPGEEVLAAGDGAWEPDPDPDLGTSGEGYRVSPRRLVITAPAAGKLMLSDDPKVLKEG